jgi:hypothetical protein
MAEYILVFPLLKSGKDKEYCLSVIVEGIGVIPGSTWHRNLNRRFHSILHALDVGQKVQEAIMKGESCPCGENCERNASWEPEPVKIFQFPNDPRSAR